MLSLSYVSESSQVAVIYTHAIDLYRSVKWVFMMDEEGKRSKLLLVGYRGRPGIWEREREGWERVEPEHCHIILASAQ